MPTSILVWNVQSFTINKINSMGTPPEVFTVGKKNFSFQMSQRRLKYILKNIKLKDPDIFVLIEVISGQGDTGSLVNSKGAAGCIYLLRYLRAINPGWCLVPPLRMIDKVQVNVKNGLQQLVKDKQYTEGVAVFYRSDKLAFQGPYMWPETDDPDNQSPHVVAIPDEVGASFGPYPPAWRNCLPKGPNYEAAQVEFFDDDGYRVRFPSTESRNPVLVQFQELTNKKRIINVVAVHLPPKEVDARTAFSRVTSYFTDWPLKNNEAMVLVGDFNLAAGKWYYKGLKNAGTNVEDAFTPVFNAATIPNSSMYYSPSQASPSKYLQPGKILDNILYRYGQNATDGIVTGAIIDRVANNSLMLNQLTQIMTLRTEARQNEIFRRYLNFGQLGPAPGTSDHLAIYAQF